MNKRFLLPVLAILCCAASKNIKAEEKFKKLNLDESTAEYLIDRTLRWKLRAYNAQRHVERVEKEKNSTAENISYAKKNALQAKHEADQIEQELITFGHQAEAAKQTEDPNDLAGRTTALELLKQLKTRLLADDQDLEPNTLKTLTKDIDGTINFFLPNNNTPSTENIEARMTSLHGQKESLVAPKTLAEELIDKTLGFKLRAYYAQQRADQVEKQTTSTAADILHAKKDALETKHALDQIEKSLVESGGLLALDLLEMLKEKLLAAQDLEPDTVIALTKDIDNTIRSLPPILIPPVDDGATNHAGQQEPFPLTNPNEENSLTPIHPKEPIPTFQTREEGKAYEQQLFIDAANARQEAAAEWHAALHAYQTAMDSNAGASEIDRLHKRVQSTQKKLEAAKQEFEDFPNYNRRYKIIPLDKESCSVAKSTDSAMSFAKAFVTNKWTKRAAGIIVPCAIAKLLYNKYTRSNKSNNRENDHE